MRRVPRSPVRNPVILPALLASSLTRLEWFDDDDGSVTGKSQALDASFHPSLDILRRIVSSGANLITERAAYLTTGVEQRPLKRTEQFSSVL
jgi:hypothetical protein